LGGTFSIETVGDVKYLVYTLGNKVVVSTGADASGSSSFNAGAKWNDGKAPHDDADYFILNGHEIRSVNGASAEFNGQSLNVLEGGKFSIIGSNKSGVTATIGDFHLSGGAVLIAKSNWGNNLAGAITILGSSSNPAIYETEWTSGSPEPSGRWLTVHSDISGSGSLLCRYLNQAATTNGAPFAGLNLRGNNTGFTGEWQIVHPAAKATFTSAANFGSASALVFNSNGVFRVQDGSFAIATNVVVNNVGSIAGSEDLTNGGTIEVDEGGTLTVNGIVSGAGILRKTGAGTLLLNAENTISGNLVVKQGAIGGTGKITSVELADGTGLDVSALQATPFEIGTLVIDGGIALSIRDAVNADLGRIAVAKVGMLTGTLGDVRATVGNGHATYNLSIEGGILYATKKGTVISIR
jgi:autotransporter-associated beta strand protein